MGPDKRELAPTEAVIEEVKEQRFEPLDTWMAKCTYVEERSMR